MIIKLAFIRIEMSFSSSITNEIDFEKHVFQLNGPELTTEPPRSMFLKQ